MDPFVPLLLVRHDFHHGDHVPPGGHPVHLGVNVLLWGVGPQGRRAEQDLHPALEVGDRRRDDNHLSDGLHVSGDGDALGVRTFSITPKCAQVGTKIRSNADMAVNHEKPTKR